MRPFECFVFGSMTSSIEGSESCSRIELYDVRIV